MKENVVYFKNIPGAKEFVDKLFNRLEDLRIEDSDFFGQTEKVQYAYKKANDKLDECLQTVMDFFKEHNWL